MNCEDFINQLAEGGSLDAAAREHARTCSFCQQLLAPLTDLDETPNPQHLSAIADAFSAHLAPVKSLASDNVIIAALTLLFVLFSIIAAWPTRYLGVHALSPPQMAIYFGVILLCAASGTAVIAQEMIPGSRRRLAPALWIGGSSVALLATWFALFPNFDTHLFVHNGIKCLSLGSCCAALAGYLLSRFLRRGFAVSKLKAAMAAAFFSSLSGIAVLALHCPVLTVPHILVWHLSVLLLGLGAGALLGRVGTKVSPS